MKNFKVKFGFDKDEFIVIDETELASAIKAQGIGKVAVFKEGTVSGNNIIAITPYYNRAMGYNRQYELRDEDYREIGPNVQEEHRTLLENTRLILQGKAPNVLNSAEVNDEVKTLATKFKL